MPGFGRQVRKPVPVMELIRFISRKRGQTNVQGRIYGFSFGHRQFWVGSGKEHGGIFHKPGFGLYQVEKGNPKDYTIRCKGSYLQRIS
jgi:hypothetical protein